MVKCEECDEAEGTEITKLIGTTPQIVGQGGVVMAPKEVTRILCADCSSDKI